MNKQPISVAILARNEDWFIRHPVVSARQVSDDVVLFDMGSTDRTAEIAAEHGARIETVPVGLMVEQGWAAVRNYTNALVEHDWVLTLDADEILSHSATRVLNKTNWPWTDDVIVTPTKTFGCSFGMTIEQARTKASNTFPHRRMFNKRRVHWQGPVHEEPYRADGSGTGNAPGTNVIREHFTQLRPLVVSTWKYGVDAQILLRMRNRKLPSTGVNPWWLATWVPSRLEKLKARAKMFFDENPEYEYLRKDTLEV